MAVLRSQKWGYVQIIAGTNLGLHHGRRREELQEEKMNERLRKYEAELKEREKKNQLDESL